MRGESRKRRKQLDDHCQNLHEVYEPLCLRCSLANGTYSTAVRDGMGRLDSVPIVAYLGHIGRCINGISM